jgi:hypothetical protein
MASIYRSRARQPIAAGKPRCAFDAVRNVFSLSVPTGRQTSGGVAVWVSVELGRREARSFAALVLRNTSR